MTTYTLLYLEARYWIRVTIGELSEPVADYLARCIIDEPGRN